MGQANSALFRVGLFRRTSVTVRRNGPSSARDLALGHLGSAARSLPLRRGPLSAIRCARWPRLRGPVPPPLEVGRRSRHLESASLACPALSPALSAPSEAR